jgi:hypothetical protein
MREVLARRAPADASKPHRELETNRHAARSGVHAVGIFANVVSGNLFSIGRCVEPLRNLRRAIASSLQSFAPRVRQRTDAVSHRRYPSSLRVRPLARSRGYGPRQSLNDRAWSFSSASGTAIPRGIGGNPSRSQQ